MRDAALRCSLLPALAAAVTVTAPAAHAQVLSWTHALGATTTLTMGVRVMPATARRADAWLRTLSPYGQAKRANGAYLLPDSRLTAHTCDVQHLRWLGIGDWSGPRILTQAMWFPVGYVGAELTNASLSMAGMSTYNLSRAVIIPGYHVDPMGYASGIGSWGVAGSLLGAHHRIGVKALGALTALWMLTFPWSTPWADDPAHCT